MNLDRRVSRRTALGLGGLALLAVGCTGGSQPTAPNALVLVVGGRANTAPPGLPDELVDDVVRAAERDTGATVIAADGAPRIVDTFRLRRTAPNDLFAERERAAQLARVRSSITSCRALVPEVDQLAALALGARAGAAAPGLRQLVLIDSGLQTSGALRFQADDGALLDVDPIAHAESLAQAGQLPDLGGAEVLLVGLGDVGEPQPRLAEPQRRALVTIWEELVRRSNGRPVVVASPLPARPVPPGLPPVSVVPLAAAPSGGFAQPVVLRDSAVGFLPDQAVFRDPAQAAAALAPFVEALSRPGRRVRLTGTTSSAGTAAGRRQLSHDRARAVATVLVDGGVDPGAIEIRGLGSDFPGFVPDRDGAGRLDPVRAARNRQVIVEPLV
ncbi:MAG: OmpA family protein [Pseudonocardia sp.]